MSYKNWAYQKYRDQIKNSNPYPPFFENLCEFGYGEGNKLFYIEKKELYDALVEFIKSGKYGFISKYDLARKLRVMNIYSHQRRLKDESGVSYRAYCFLGIRLKKLS